MFAHASPRGILHGADLNVGAVLHHACAVAREAVCGLGGHDYLVRASGNRLFLECLGCGHETPGWRIDIVRRAPKERRRPG